MRISTQELYRRYYYNLNDGILRHKLSYGRHRLGDPVGSLTNDGYVITSINYKRFKVHRIIYQMYHGAIDEFLSIDHIDGNRSNNRINNLRLVTRWDNQKNQKLRATNTSGVQGVSWNNQKHTWNAYITFHYKKFSLGAYTHFKDAVAARKLAEQKYGFHPNHGRL